MDNLEQYLLETYRLKNVIRYNCRNKLKAESVAEHSFYVTLFALQLCDKYHLSDDIKLNCLVKALLHDMPEIELNDITHDVKDKLNLRAMLKHYEDKYYTDNFQMYVNIMNNENEIVDAVIKLADAMSVYQYTLNELNLGNKSPDMTCIFDESKQRVSHLQLLLQEKIKEI